MIASMPELHPAIAHLVERLQQLPSVERVLLFGSRARGDAHPRSDVDLAVQGALITPAEWQMVLEWVEQAETLLPIDCIWLDEADSQLKATILQFGKPLFVRDSTQ
jgi:predicted nucleotidyltransferase